MQLMGSATDTDTDTPINSSLIVGRPVVDKEHLSVVDGSTIGSAHLSPTKPFTYDIDGSIIDTAAAGPYAGYFADPELETSSSSSSVVDRRPESASSEYRFETDDYDDDNIEDDDDDDDEEEVVDEDDPSEGWGSSDDNDVEGSDLEDGEVVIADPISMRRNRSMKRKRKRRLEEEAAAPDTSYEMQRHALSPQAPISPSPISSSQSGDDPDSSSSSGDDDFSDFEAMILQRTGQMQRPASSGPAWSLPSQGRSLVRNNNNHQGNNKYQDNHSNRGSDTTGNDDDSNSPNSETMMSHV
jgi:hypothetical protein